MNQTYISLELAIANDDLDLFFQGSGIYSFGDNTFYPVRRSVMADEAMNIIYSYYGETLNQSIVEKVEKCICELLSCKFPFLTRHFPAPKSACEHMFLRTILKLYSAHIYSFCHFLLKYHRFGGIIHISNNRRYWS